MYVFVYGTLMRGFGNHRVMEQAKGKYVGRAKMFGKSMYDVGGFPVVVDGGGDIVGEVYLLPENDIEYTNWYNQKIRYKPIAILDNLEGYSPDRPKDSNMYLRKKAKVQLENGMHLWVSYYYWNRGVGGMRKINSGDYREVRR